PVAGDGEEEARRAGGPEASEAEPAIVVSRVTLDRWRCGGRNLRDVEGDARRGVERGARRGVERDARRGVERDAEGGQSRRPWAGGADARKWPTHRAFRSGRRSGSGSGAGCADAVGDL